MPILKTSMLIKAKGRRNSKRGLAETGSQSFKPIKTQKIRKSEAFYIL
uniref:Uncharacterized protein n=1 Tax=Rhizophora mucronata TaxID=61149 RepID=A0A2P2JQ21_RHIMU